MANENEPLEDVPPTKTGGLSIAMLVLLGVFRYFGPMFEINTSHSQPALFDFIEFPRIFPDFRRMHFRARI